MEPHVTTQQERLEDCALLVASEATKLLQHGETERGHHLACVADELHAAAHRITAEVARADAAPDLLEALEGLLVNAPAPKGIRKDYSYTLYREAAKVALAKARGEGA